MKKYFEGIQQIYPTLQMAIRQNNARYSVHMIVQVEHLLHSSSFHTSHTNLSQSPTSPREPIAHHPARKVPRQPRPIHGIRRETRSMAKLVAPRVRKRIRERQNKRNRYSQSAFPPCPPTLKSLLTNQREPDELEAHERHDGEQDPQHGLRVQGNPEEALVRRVLLPAAFLGALKHPAAVARGGVDLVPPAQADEAAPGNVLEVVEVGG